MTQENPSLSLSAVGVVGKRIELLSDSAADIAAFTAAHPALRTIDCCGKLLMPGLINAHTHVSMTLQRGLGDDIELMKWLHELVWPFEALQSDDDIEAGARLGIAEMLLGGTTTFVDMYWSEFRVAKAVEELGIRALLCESCIVGEKAAELEKSLPKLVEAAKTCDRITAAVGPHAPYTCPPQVLARCNELTEQLGAPTTIHLAETKDEEKTIRETYNLSPTEYLDKCGVLTPSTILAHSVHLSPSDIALIKERGAHVAHNPQCNMKISSGAAPIAALVESGVNCTIGTDGAGSNNDLDMWDEMRTAAFLQKLTTMSPTALSAYQVLQMATVNGAKAIGRQGELGVIAPGALADLIVVDILRPHYRPHHDIVSSLVYCGKAADVEMVMVDGELLVENHTLIAHDINEICNDVEQRSYAILSRI